MEVHCANVHLRGKSWVYKFDIEEGWSSQDLKYWLEKTHCIHWRAVKICEMNKIIQWIAKNWNCLKCLQCLKCLRCLKCFKWSAMEKITVSDLHDVWINVYLSEMLEMLYFCAGNQMIENPYWTILIAACLRNACEHARMHVHTCAWKTYTLNKRKRVLHTSERSERGNDESWCSV